jgi:hypothetical protein
LGLNGKDKCGKDHKDEGGSHGLKFPAKNKKYKPLAKQFGCKHQQLFLDRVPGRMR